MLFSIPQAIIAVSSIEIPPLACTWQSKLLSIGLPFWKIAVGGDELSGHHQFLFWGVILVYRLLRAFGLLVILLGCILPGCGERNSSGPKRHQVSGTVNLDGKPLETGEILFLPESGGTSLSGTAIRAGRFLVPKANGLVAGYYKVSVSSMELKPLPDGAPRDPMGDSMQAIEMIPARYNQKTELTMEVNDHGNNVTSYELMSQ